MQKHLEQETTISQQKQKLELAISNLAEEINDIETDINERQHELAHKFHYIIQASGTDFLRNLFESKNAGQLERNLKFLTISSNLDLTLIKAYKKRAFDLENKKIIEKQRYSVLNDLEQKLRLEEFNLKSDVDKKNAVLSKFINTDQDEQASLNKQFIDSLKNGDIESAEKYSMLIGKSFIDKRGFLNWPNTGVILQKFGLIKDLEFRIHLPFKGIFIDTSTNNVIKSVAFGKVVQLAQTKDNYYTLIINHGLKYHTLYGNLTHVTTALGDTIQEGQVLGHAAKEPLYFEIREGLQAKDPLKWLTINSSLQKKLLKTENWEKVK
jgi:murein DD-endopeptidase MepM/ murein hydrolase activator NlpD